MERRDAPVKRTTRRLALDAMLSAMFVVLSLISISLPNMKITLDALPVLVASLLFGPLDGLSVGLIGSFLNQLLTYGLSPTTLLWILPAGLRGLLVGLYAKRHRFKLTVRQLIMITVVTALLTTAFNTLIMYLDSVIIGYSFAATLPTVFFRIVAGIMTSIVFSLVLPGIIKVLKKLDL